MTRRILTLLLTILSGVTFAQVRVGKLVIKSHESYDLGQSDILVADTLVMQDSSRLILNKLKQENFIRVQVAVFGNHCIIDGRGVDGKPGRSGKDGFTPVMPCSNGSPGRNGGRGLDGTRGINLFLYLENITLNGKLIIDLGGGTGGKGGNGGNGGGGSPGTVHCLGGDGSNGGNAGQGGNGADGGTLTVSSHKNPKIQEWVGKRIIVRNAGGVAGPGGRAGYHGPAGLGPSRRNGKDGAPGLESSNGITGVHGHINFELN